MKPQTTRLMKVIIRLHPLLEDPELRQAYQACEIAMKGKPKGKCLMRNSGVTIEDIKASFDDDLSKADAKHYYNLTLDWSDGNDVMRTNWVSVAKGIARRDLAAGKLVISKHVQDGGSNYNPDKFVPSPKSKSAMTREEWKKSEEYKKFLNGQTRRV